MCPDPSPAEADPPGVAVVRRPASVSGHVRSATGQPIASALVTIGEMRLVTNAEGAFNLANLEPGSYKVQITAAGYEAASQSVRLDPGEAERINVVLRPATGSPKPQFQLKQR